MIPNPVAAVIVFNGGGNNGWQQQGGAGSWLLAFDALGFVRKNRKSTVGRKVPYLSYQIIN